MIFLLVCPSKQLKESIEPWGLCFQGKLEATATELVDYRTKYIRLQEEQSELEAALDQLSEGQESDSFAQLRSSKTGLYIFF